MPKLRRPHIASPDEVKITRDGDAAVFEYADPSVATTHFKIGGEKLAKMSDAELLQYWNEYIEATDEFRRKQKPFTLTEIPVGRPQVEYSRQSDQWVPRGHVVRAMILTDAAIEPALDEPFVCDARATEDQGARTAGTKEASTIAISRSASSSRASSATNAIRIPQPPKVPTIVLLASDMAKVAASRDYRQLAEVARLAQYDAPVDFAATDRALYQAWRNGVTQFHLGGWTYMTAQRVVAIAKLANKPIPETDYAARNPPLNPGASASVDD